MRLFGYIIFFLYFCRRLCVMLFYSIEYVIFFSIVFVIYWLLGKNYKWQNVALLLASYVFYAWWDWRLLGLLLGMGLCAWICGAQIAKSLECSGGG